MNRRQFLSIPAILPLVKRREQENRLIFITDVHIKDESRILEKISNYIEQILDCEPSLIINGGDSVFCTNYTSYAETKSQWKAWHKSFDKINVPFKHCLGNHDLYNVQKTYTINQYHKYLAAQELELDNRYYSFNFNSYLFIILDSTYLGNDGVYCGKIDDEQYQWLKVILEEDRFLPKVIVSHIPIFSAVILDESSYDNENLYASGMSLHLDCNKLHKLFLANNVKLCLSGHSHVYDYIKYRGIEYICSGPVSGNWWNGEFYRDTRSGFLVIDFYDEGIYTEYVNFQ